MAQNYREMTHYFVFGCEQLPLDEDDPRDVYVVKEAFCETAEQAARNSLTNEQIVSWDWTVIEVEDSFHADEFRQYDTFEDIEP